jgi:hypothetical protein
VQEMQDKCVAAAVEEVAQFVSLRSGGSGLTPPAFVAAEVIRRLAASSHLLLVTFVQRCTREPTALVCEHFSASALSHGEPGESARPVCSKLVELMREAAVSTAALLPSGQALQPAMQPQVRICCYIACIALTDRPWCAIRTR